MFDTLRQELARRSVHPRAVILPGDDGPALEGALRLSPDADGWLLETVDYGRSFALGSAPDDGAAATLLLAYLDRPIPEETTLPEAEVERAVQNATAHFADLQDRAASGSLLIELPSGVALDRIGALDGTMLFPYGTAYEARSLPPVGVLPEGSERHAFLTRSNVLVRVEIAQPWFGQRGGGLRCTLAQDFVGIRDLVVSGALERIRVDG